MDNAYTFVNQALTRLRANRMLPGTTQWTRETRLTELGVDSLGKLTLLGEIEAMADVTLEPTDFAAAVTLADVAAIIDRALNNQPKST